MGGRRHKSLYTSKPIWCSGDTQSFTATTTFTTPSLPPLHPGGVSASASVACRGWTVAGALAWKGWRSVSQGSGWGCNVTHCGECGPYIQYLPGGGITLLGYLSFFMLFPPVPNNNNLKKRKEEKKRKKLCECQCENATVITSNTQCLMFCSILGMPSEGLGKMRRSSRCPWETDIKTLCQVPAGSLSVHGPHRAAGGAVGWVPQYTRGHVDRQSLVMQIRHDTWFGTSAVRLGSSCSEGGAWLPPAVYCEGGLSSLIYTVVCDTVYSVEWGADSKRGREDGLSLRRWTHHLSTPFRVSVESVWANDRDKLCESCSPVCVCVCDMGEFHWRGKPDVHIVGFYLCTLLLSLPLWFVLAHFKIFFEFFVCFTRTSAPAFCNTVCKVLHMDACQHPLNFCHSDCDECSFLVRLEQLTVGNVCIYRY